MSEYICFSSKGHQERALYYKRGAGRKKPYRSTYPTPKYDCLILLTYKTQEAAAKVRDEVNKMYGDDFIVYIASDEEIAEVKENTKKLKKGVKK